MPLIRKPPAPEQAAAPESAAGALAHGARDERFVAARLLADSEGGVESLSRALLTETDVQVREAIFTALARIATDASARAVLPHIRSAEAARRRGAVDALRAMPRAVAPHLPALLMDADPDVRVLACEIVRALPIAIATETLLPVLEKDEDANVCAAAVEVLAETAGPEALPALRRCGERFAGAPFLTFALEAAAARIDGQARGDD